MKVKIDLNMPLEEALKTYGTIVVEGENKYSFLPYWFDEALKNN